MFGLRALRYVGSGGRRSLFVCVVPSGFALPSLRSLQGGRALSSQHGLPFLCKGRPDKERTTSSRKAPRAPSLALVRRAFFCAAS